MTLTGRKNEIILLKKNLRVSFRYVIYLERVFYHPSLKETSMFKGDGSKCQIMGIIMAY